ncbi:hypothetical protein D0469_06445 [Peribacillus saganii]|uniref:EamA domain-containing protein n=1 Tax=Peribacillus saganii TaxID=2303992 RepID=A0A372LRY6_9BACI|nr:hypothetical protein D0469_06445 [Peribacillus saganii]
MPLIAILFSSILLKEDITLNLLVALILIVVSILFVNIKLKTQTVSDSVYNNED